MCDIPPSNPTEILRLKWLMIDRIRNVSPCDSVCKQNTLVFKQTWFEVSTPTCDGLILNKKIFICISG